MVVIPGEECFQVLVGIKCESLQRQELKYVSDAVRIKHGRDPKTGERVCCDPRGDGDCEPTADCCGPVSVANAPSRSAKSGHDEIGIAIAIKLAIGMLNRVLPGPVETHASVARTVLDLERALLHLQILKEGSSPK